jgi:hypothetical protein
MPAVWRSFAWQLDTALGGGCLMLLCVLFGLAVLFGLSAPPRGPAECPAIPAPAAAAPARETAEPPVALEPGEQRLFERLRGHIDQRLLEAVREADAAADGDRLHARPGAFGGALAAAVASLVAKLVKRLAEVIVLGVLVALAWKYGAAALAAIAAIAGLSGGLAGRRAAKP